MPETPRPTPPRPDASRDAGVNRPTVPDATTRAINAAVPALPVDSSAPIPTPAASEQTRSIAIPLQEGVELNLSPDAARGLVARLVPELGPAEIRRIVNEEIDSHRREQGAPGIALTDIRESLRNPDASKVTQEQVARELDWSTSKLVRIENGDVRPSATDIRALAERLGVTDPEQIEALVENRKHNKWP